MLKILTAAFAFAITPAAADTLQPWQVAALEKVREYSRVTDAAWQTDTLLYLFAYDADITWDNIADQVSCNHLVAAGMPENSNVMVVFYEHAAALQGKAKRLGYAVCK